MTKTGSGTLNLLGSNSYTAATSVGGGRLDPQPDLHHQYLRRHQPGATLELAEAPSVTLKTTSVIAPGKLDLKDNKVVITAQPVGSFNGTSYTGVTGMIASALQLQRVERQRPDHHRCRRRRTASPASSSPPRSRRFTCMFGGVSVAPSNVLVMYTYAGDADLNGVVDAVDYGTIDNWIQFPGTDGYCNGDFNYDGVIDAVDYGHDRQQHPASRSAHPHRWRLRQLPGALPMDAAGGGTTMSGVTAVPEPSAAAAAVSPCSPRALLTRRRRRHRAYVARARPPPTVVTFSQC